MMNESIECPPASGIFRGGIEPASVGQELDVQADRAQCDGLFLKVDLGALMMRVGKGADQQKTHGD